MQVGAGRGGFAKIAVALAPGVLFVPKAGIIGFRISPAGVEKDHVVCVQRFFVGVFELVGGVVIQIPC